MRRRYDAASCNVRWRPYAPLLLALLSIFPESAQPQLVLVRPPEFSYANTKWMMRVAVKEGGSLSLQCPVDNPAAEIAWLHDGKTPSKGPVHSPLLHIFQVSRQDAGAWRCQAKNAFVSVVSKPTEVDVQYLDDFDGSEDALYSLSVIPEKAFVLRRPRLVASPNIQPIYRWYCDQDEVIANSSFYLTYNGDLVVLDKGGTRLTECAVTAAVDGLNEIRSKAYSITRSRERGSTRDFSIVYFPEDQRVRLPNEEEASVSYLAYPDLRFECVPSIPNARVEWVLDGKEMTDAIPGVSLHRSGRSLSIAVGAAGVLLQAQLSNLECKAEAAAGRLRDSKAAKLRIFRSPKVRSLPKEIFREQHDKLELECAEGSMADATASWTFNTVQVSRTSRLVIPDMTPSSFGVYQCEIVNDAGSDMLSVWVQEGERRDSEPNVLFSMDDPDTAEGDAFDETPRSRFRSILPSFSPSMNHENDTSTPSRGPSILIAPQSKAVASGDANFSLDCSAAGQPTPTIVWRFNETEVRPSAKYLVDDSKLTVMEVRKSDAGVYECEARNENGVSRTTAEVAIQGGSLLEYGPTNQSILIGSNIEIPCQVAEEYAVKAEIIWYIKGERVPPSGDPSMRVSREGGSKGALLIKQVGPDNIGEYRCVVRVGEREQTTTAWLQIVEKPGMPKFVRAELLNDTKPAKVLVSWREGFDGNSPILRHSIEMRTLSTAAAQLHWSDWERVVESVPAEACCSAVLDNVRPSATAQFRVLAANRHGTGKPSLPSGNVTLPQMPPAAAPTKVHATARGPRTVMVQWQRPTSDQWNGDINGYLVRHRLNGYTVPWITVNITDGGRMNHAVENLLVWKEYEFQVAAYNSRGEGVFSASVLATTLEGAPTQAPKNVQMNVLNSTAVAVTFQQPDEQFINGVNLGYKVQLRGMRRVGNEFVPDEEGAVAVEEQVEPDGQELQTVLGGLVPFGHYTLSVLCFTSAGSGPRSPSMPVVTEESTPGVVDDLHVENVLFSEAFISWKAPKESNGLITQYEIRHWSEITPEDVKVTQVSGSVFNFTLQGLSASTKYAVDLQAATSKGAGPREEIRFESGVPPELPGRPSGLIVSNMTARTVKLSFAPGFDGHSPIRVWYVEGRIGESSMFHAIFNVSAPKARSITVEGLRPHTAYQLRLIAENVRGRGGPSEPSRQFKTAQTAPEAPSSKLWAEPISSSAISLSWTPLQSTQWNGEPIGYLVTYRPVNATGGDDEAGEERRAKEVRTRSLRATELTLKNLQPWTNYEIALYSENVVGRSAKAGSGVLARTYEGAPAGAPTDVTAEPRGDREVLIKWNEVPEQHRSGIILGYKVRLIPEEKRLRAAFSRETRVNTATQLTESFSHLRSATAYLVVVAAFTFIGDGPESKPVLVQTNENVPGRPSGVGFSIVKSNSVKLKFMPPEDPNGVVTQYIVTHMRANDVEGNKVIAPLPPTLFSFDAVGLAPRTEYVFTVAAQNKQGTGEAAVVEVFTANVNETLPLPNPSQPQLAMRLPRSSEEIVIAWREEGIESESGRSLLRQPVRAVQVEYQRKGSNWTRVTPDVPGTENSARIPRLSPNTEYAFRIRFAGDSALSAWSAASGWLRTLTAAPSAPPSNIALSPYDADSVTISFTPPEKLAVIVNCLRSTWNADGIGFLILYRTYPFLEEDSNWKEMVVAERNEFSGSERLQHTIKPLNSFRHYAVQLRSRNAQGSSPPSTPAFVYVGFAVPRRNITGLIVEPHSASSIAVRWDEWKAEEREQINGFKVRYAPLLSVLSKDSEQEGLVIVEENEVLVIDLMKFTPYQISVSAYNRAGEGEPVTARVATLEDAPGPVGELKFSNVLLESVNVSWTDPVEKNGRIIGYLITYKMYHLRGDTRKEQQVRVTEPFLVAKGLDEGETYFFSVRAETGAGRGPEVSANVTIGPVKGGPPAPSHPVLIPAQSSVYIEWEQEGKGYIGHVVQAKRIAKAVNRTITSGIDDRHRVRRSHTTRPTHPIGDWVTVSIGEGNSVEVSYYDLHPSSFYVFRVFGRNEAGIGPPSAESEQLFVPETLPSDWFYTSPWFVVVAGLCLLLLIVIVVSCLCVTGGKSSESAASGSTSHSKKKAKKPSPSSSSLQFDGNFPLQMKPKDYRNGGNARRNDLLVRPGTTTSWISERDQHGGVVGYGSVLQNSSSPIEGMPVNMYGLATDLMPSSVNSEGREENVNGNGSDCTHRMSSMNGDHRLQIGLPHHMAAIYGSATIRATPASSHRMTSHADFDADSFDDDFDDEEDESRSQPVEDIAAHYDHADKYRDTWRRVRNTEAVSVREAGNLHLPPSFNAPTLSLGGGGSIVLGGGSNQGAASHHADSSIESSSEHSWQPPLQSAPPLTKFSSFV